MHDFLRFFSSVAVGAIALTGVVTGSANASSHNPTPTACSGVTSCHVVRRTDVDGNGRLDEVGWRQLGQDAVQIRVRLAGGALLTHRVDVRLWWGGGAWAGAAHVDNQPGTELLVGSEQGAHTPMYTMLTYRNGRLVVENSPSSLGDKWMVDAAYGDYIGWFRQVGPQGRVTMTQKVAVRVEGTDRFTGTNTRYGRTAHGWTPLTTTHVRYPTVKAATAAGGFHVSGLKRFPGLS